jgi:hypothetical protein
VTIKRPTRLPSVEPPVRRDYIERRLPPWPEDAERWARFCATIDLLIEKAREGEPVRCSACEAISTVTRRCSRCGRVAALASGVFARDRSKFLGFGHLCRSCKRAENIAAGLRRKQRAWRGEAAS